MTRPRVREFALERYLRAGEARARIAIGGSGVPLADLRPFLPPDADAWAALWATSADDAARALAEAVARSYGMDADEIVPTAGASEADLAAAVGLAGPGARVVVEHPAYHALLAPAEAIGCRVTRVRRHPPDFALDADEVIASMGRDARLVALARPHNPSGAVVPDADLERIAEAAVRIDAHVLVDEVFADATALGDRPARRLHDRIVSVGSVTKCLGLGPLRVGWLVARRDAVEALDRARAVASVVPNVLGQMIAARALDRRRELIEPLRERRRHNAGTLAGFVREQGIAWSAPEHGTTAVVASPVPDDAAFAQALLDEDGVLVAPGSLVETPGWLRVGLAGDEAALIEGLARLCPRAGGIPRVGGRGGGER